MRQGTSSNVGVVYHLLYHQNSFDERCAVLCNRLAACRRAAALRAATDVPRHERTVLRFTHPEARMHIPCRVSHYAIVALALTASGGWSQTASAQNHPGRVATKVEYEGWRQYMTTCARCHGDDAVGGIMAPDLRKTVASDSASQTSFHATVAEGRPAKGMPSFAQ